jgi:hypothetical protein
VGRRSPPIRTPAKITAPDPFLEGRVIRRFQACQLKRLFWLES